MRVLVVGQTVWDNTNNSGNTLSNLFSGIDAVFAHIYCSGGYPNNNLCKRYFQITDKMIINHFLKLHKIGKSFSMDKMACETNQFEVKTKKFSNFLTKIFRDVLWCSCNLDSKELYQFIEDFDPDIIYAPCFGNLRMNKLIQKLKKRVNLPVISYISDDLYSYKESMNFIERIYHNVLRRSIKRSFGLYDKIYTMTETQKAEYSEEFGKPLAILRKSSLVEPTLQRVNSPVRFIYAGGLYLGRDKVLCKLIDAMNLMSEKKLILDVYSNECELLPDSKVLNKCAPVNYEELLKNYSTADVALHIESFDKKYRQLTRLSFSTKIVDCLQSGCAVFAICPAENSGFKFLEEEDAALCYSDESLEGLDGYIGKIIDEHTDYQMRALKCLKNNFSQAENKKRIEEDFRKVIREYIR